jgi:hypothetical protein
MPIIQKPRPPASGSASVGFPVVVKPWVKLTPPRRSCPACLAAWALIEPEPAKKSLTANGAAVAVVSALPVVACVSTRASSGAKSAAASAGGALGGAP